jgi:hypothetical protein
MADTYYIAHYSDVSGYVVGLYLRGDAATTSNAATANADGYLEIEGVHVLEGVGSRTDLEFAVLLNPTANDTEGPTNIMVVNNPALPTNAVFRTDGGKHPNYEYPA